MIKIPQHKTDKVKRGQRGANRNAAILVLSKGQMRYGVFQFPEDLCTSIEIKAQWKWHNVLHDDFGVHLIRDVDLRVVLKLLKIGRGKKRQAMRFDSFVIEAVQHMDQSTIKHFQIIGLSAL